MLGKEKDSVTHLKNLKLICVNLFELYFLQTFQVRTKIEVNEALKHKDLKNLSTGERLGENLFER